MGCSAVTRISEGRLGYVEVVLHTELTVSSSLPGAATDSMVEGGRAESRKDNDILLGGEL